jgi:hypothetical protein
MQNARFKMQTVNVTSREAGGITAAIPMLRNFMRFPFCILHCELRVVE